jgi:hypothetical protein
MGFADLLADNKATSSTPRSVACDVQNQQAMSPTFPFTPYPCELVWPSQALTTPHSQYEVLGFGCWGNEDRLLSSALSTQADIL